jgi:putative ubiquitin-RnfH superfamily antitoxin RatB of RatAB toxin-antitoxin module
MTGPVKRCVVAYATPSRQDLWHLELPADATVADALQAARQQAHVAGVEGEIPWDTAAVGIFGQASARSEVPRDGDRIEIYRPLAGDPRERRRARLRAPR